MFGSDRTGKIEANKELHVSYLWVVEFAGVQNSKHYVATNTQNISGEVQEIIQILKAKLSEDESVHPDTVFAHHIHLEGTTIGYTKPISAVKQPCLELDGDRIVPNEAFIRETNRRWSQIGPSPMEKALKEIKTEESTVNTRVVHGPNFDAEVEEGLAWEVVRKRFEHLLPPGVLKKSE